VGGLAGVSVGGPAVGAETISQSYSSGTVTLRAGPGRRAAGRLGHRQNRRRIFDWGSQCIRAFGVGGLIGYGSVVATTPTGTWRPPGNHKRWWSGAHNRQLKAALPPGFADTSGGLFRQSLTLFLLGVHAPSSITLTAAPDPSTVGQSVTFTATIAGLGGGVPTGNVTFFGRS